ncbi:MAG TPA: hypothetical protein VF538_01770 [Pyrinomonadaceae bacterium]|jgi:hypothetical protein
MTTGQEPKRASKREPGALTSEYHKARKQLMLWAGTLLIWEFVGIDLEKAKEAEGNVGALVKSIKSPQAVPWVLLILVAYFLFKLTVEWYQCNEGRRGMKVAKIDFFSAWVVSLLAYVLYFAQAISRVQFADVLQGSNNMKSLLTGFLSGMFFGLTVYAVWPRRGVTQTPLFLRLIQLGTAILGFLALLIGALTSGGIRWRLGLSGIVLGASFIASMHIVDIQIVSRFNKRYTKAAGR